MSLLQCHGRPQFCLLPKMLLVAILVSLLVTQVTPILKMVTMEHRCDRWWCKLSGLVDTSTKVLSSLSVRYKPCFYLLPILWYILLCSKPFLRGSSVGGRWNPCFLLDTYISWLASSCPCWLRRPARRTLCVFHIISTRFHIYTTLSFLILSCEFNWLSYCQYIKDSQKPDPTLNYHEMSLT